MVGSLRTVIIGTGSYIPPLVVRNESFLRAPDDPSELRKFYGPDGDQVRYSDGEKGGQIKPTEEIVGNVEKITGIRERRWVPGGVVNSDISLLAARDAVASSGVDPRTIDLVIVAHNFGDQRQEGTRLDLVPSIGSRVKNRLDVRTPTPIAADIITTPDRLEWFAALYEKAAGEENLFLGRDPGSRSTDADSMAEAARAELRRRGVSPDKLNHIVVAHLDTGGGIDCIADKVKTGLGLSKEAIAYDLIFGCPGWIQGMIEADRHLKAGRARRALVIGADTLSRVSEQTNMDCMIFADGAGAAICEAKESAEAIGIRSYVSRSDADKANLLRLGKPYRPDYRGDNLFIEMHGHAVFKYAIKHLAPTITSSLQAAGIGQAAVDKFLLHQANAKMDYAIYEKLAGQNGSSRDHRVPMTVAWLGNSSVATIPTMLDLICKRDPRIGDHRIDSGNILVFASVGAGMNINSMVYQAP